LVVVLVVVHRISLSIPNQKQNADGEDKSKGADEKTEEEMKISDQSIKLASHFSGSDEVLCMVAVCGRFWIK